MIEDWGIAADGSTVRRITIASASLTARVLTFGAALQDLRLDGHPYPLTLGHRRFQPYLENQGHIGVVVGRVANRIANATAPIAGKTCHFDRNFLGKHTLHGGQDGMSFRQWTIIDRGMDFVRLHHTLPNGHMGFPGCLNAEITYRVNDMGSLETILTAMTDAPTLCNLTTHSYFNLDGADTIRHHWFQVDADHVLPIDSEGIPTGQPEALDGHQLDFRTTRPLAEAGKVLPLDANFCLDRGRRPLRHVATLGSTASAVTLDVATTEPGLQVYSGAGLPQPYAGFAIEPQIWPDAPNWPEYPSAQLLPGETYRHHSTFSFRRSD